MSTEVSVPTEPSEASTAQFDLGTWMGRRQAFSIVAGRASAADVECLRQIRDQKMYLAKTRDWGEFCQRYLGASKSQVNDQIRKLVTFGPQYFQLAQIMRIPSDA